jgi:hypothetical protein
MVMIVWLLAAGLGGRGRVAELEIIFNPCCNVFIYYFLDLNGKCKILILYFFSSFLPPNCQIAGLSFFLSSPFRHNG